MIMYTDEQTTHYPQVADDDVDVIQLTNAAEAYFDFRTRYMATMGSFLGGVSKYD